MRDWVQENSSAGYSRSFHVQKAHRAPALLSLGMLDALGKPVGLGADWQLDVTEFVLIGTTSRRHRGDLPRGGLSQHREKQTVRIPFRN